MKFPCWFTAPLTKLTRSQNGLVPGSNPSGMNMYEFHARECSFEKSPV